MMKLSNSTTNYKTYSRSSTTKRAAFFSMATMVTMSSPTMVLGAVTTPAGFRQFGQTVVGDSSLNMAQVEQGNHLEFGSVVRVSDDGQFMAVGAPSSSKDGGSEEMTAAVTLYKRDDATVQDAIEETTWRQVWQLTGEPNEQLVGEGMDMSGDGSTIAVRRGDSSVEVYKVDAATGKSSLVGAPIDVCGPNAKGSKTVSLGKTATNSFSQVSGGWLTVSCEDYDSYRGKIVTLKYDQDEEEWTTKATIEGESKGDRFGWATAINVYGGTMATIAVSSPNHDSKRGKVQVFGFGSSGEATQSGKDIVGATQGDQFGFSLDMNFAGGTQLVIGAPQCDDRTGYNGVNRGCVSMYSWGYSKGWDLVGNPVIGHSDNDKLGRAVAISKNGQRFAASSYLHDRQAGYVNLYEKDSSTRVKEIATFEDDEQLSRFGYGVNLNENGSILVAGASRAKNGNNASVGLVRAYLDATPFCGIPTVVTPTNALFLERKTCRNSIGSVISTEKSCGLNKVNNFQGGESACVWRDGLATQMPSTSPSTVPSVGPTTVPTVAPSTSPTTTPTDAPTAVPSANPTLNKDGDYSGNDGGSVTTGDYGYDINDGNSFPKQREPRQATLSPNLEEPTLQDDMRYYLSEYKVWLISGLVGLVLVAILIGACFAKLRARVEMETAVAPPMAAKKVVEAEPTVLEVSMEDGVDSDVDVEQGIPVV